MYESPITLITDKIISEIRNDYEKTIYSAVQNVGISVNKEELVKALNYDRQQYEKGYEDGLNADKWISVDDRLPEEEINPNTLDYKDVICLCKFNQNEDIRVYKYGNNHFWNGAGIMDENIIAWQPLPNKPREKK